VDRHKIWRLVSNNRLSLNEHNPEGFEAVVDVFLIGRPDPIRLAQVRTDRAADFPWTLLVSTEEIRRSMAAPRLRP
jgi:hypothetical protein